MASEKSKLIVGSKKKTDEGPASEDDSVSALSFEGASSTADEDEALATGGPVDIWEFRCAPREEA